jgi:hypothetical protein
MGVVATQIKVLILQIYTFNAALGVTAALVTAITGGLALLGAGAALLSIGEGAMNAFDSAGNNRPLGASSTNPRGGDTTINVEGNLDSETGQKIRDITSKQRSKRNMKNGMGF